MKKQLNAKKKDKKKSEKISKISISPSKPKKQIVDLSFLKLGSPLEIINSSSMLIKKYGRGEIEDESLKSIAYVISSVTIPAYKLLAEEKLAERYTRISDALEKRNELMEKQQNEIS
jgi:hypothetical protein